MICPVCHQPVLTERPHAHAVSEKDQQRLDEDLAWRIKQAEQSESEEG